MTSLTASDPRMVGPGPSSLSQARWELENAVHTVQDADVDAVYHWNPAEQREMQQARPWLQDPTYFKRWVAGCERGVEDRDPDLE